MNNEDVREDYSTEFDGKIISFKDAIIRYKKLENEIKELVSSINKLRGGASNLQRESPEWEKCVENDSRLPVKLLYSQLMTKRMLKTTLELSYMYGISGVDVNNLNHGHSVSIKAYTSRYKLKED